MKVSVPVNCKSKPKRNRHLIDSFISLSHLSDSANSNNINKWMIKKEITEKKRTNRFEVFKVLYKTIVWLIRLWDFENHLNLTLSQSRNNLSIIKSVFEFKISNQKSKSNGTFQWNDCLFQINQIQIHETHIWLVIKSIDELVNCHSWLVGLKSKVDF